MPLETATYISDLNAANPVGSSDLVSSLDDHMRLVKNVLKGTFPNANAAINPTPAQFNILATDGAGAGMLADIASIAAPGADALLVWDFSATGVAAFSIGAGLETNATTLQFDSTIFGVVTTAEVQLDASLFDCNSATVDMDGTTWNADYTNIDIDAVTSLTLEGGSAAFVLSGSTAALTGGMTATGDLVSNFGGSQVLTLGISNGGISFSQTGSGATFNFNALDDGSSGANYRFGRNTNTSGNHSITLLRGNNSTSVAARLVAFGSTASGAALHIGELAAADTPAAAQGQIWVKNTTPNTLWFTDDAGGHQEVGHKGVPGSQVSDSLSVTEVYNGRLVVRTLTGSNNVMTIDNTVSEGFTCSFHNRNAANMVLTRSGSDVFVVAGVSGTQTTVTVAQYGFCTITQYTNGVFLATGVLIS